MEEEEEDEEREGEVVAKWLENQFEERQHACEYALWWLPASVIDVNGV